MTKLLAADQFGVTEWHLVCPDPSRTDVVTTITTDAALEVLREIAQERVENGHVTAETLAAADAYTGGRTYKG